MVRALQRRIERNGRAMCSRGQPDRLRRDRVERESAPRSRRCRPPWRNPAAAARRRNRASAARRSGSRARRLMAFESASQSPGGTSTPSMPLRMNSGMPAKSRRHDREFLACRFHEHIRQSVPVAGCRFLGRQHEEVRFAQQRDDIGLRLRAEKRHPIANASSLQPAPSGCSARSPPPTWAKRQCRSDGSAARARSRSPKPFLGDGAARPRRCERDRPGSEPSRIGRCSGGDGKRDRSSP